MRPLTRADGAYDETDRLAASLAGAETVFLVSAGLSQNRLAEHYSAVEAVVRSSARHIVYLSFFGAAADCTFTLGRDHFHTEQRIRETGIGFTSLRDNFYQSLVPAFADASGVIRDLSAAAGSARSTTATWLMPLLRCCSTRQSRRRELRPHGPGRAHDAGTRGCPGEGLRPAGDLRGGDR